MEQTKLVKSEIHPRRIRLVAYGASLESWLGASPRGFESPILRHCVALYSLGCRPILCSLYVLYVHLDVHLDVQFVIYFVLLLCLVLRLEVRQLRAAL